MPLHDEKIVDFPLSYHPLLPPKTLWMGSIGQNFNFFPEQHQHKPTKTFVPGQHARIQEFFCQGEGGGPGSSTYFTVYRGGPMVLLHIFQGVGPTFSRGGGVQMLMSIESHISITCDFPRGFGPPIPLWIRKCTMWHFGTNMLRRACAASF